MIYMMKIIGCDHIYIYIIRLQIGETEFITNLYKDYIVDKYEKKYRFKLHSGRVGDNINTKKLISRLLSLIVKTIL